MIFDQIMQDRLSSLMLAEHTLRVAGDPTEQIPFIDVRIDSLLQVKWIHRTEQP